MVERCSKYVLLYHYRPYHDFYVANKLRYGRSFDLITSKEVVDVLNNSMMIIPLPPEVLQFGGPRKRVSLTHLKDIDLYNPDKYTSTAGWVILNNASNGSWTKKLEKLEIEANTQQVPKTPKLNDCQQIRETLPPVDLSQSTIDHRMFDYKTPPLNMHVQIFQDRTFFFISIHHMLCDAIMEVTVNELEELYLADCDEVVEINEGPS
ncbi:hypothetical protein CONCODRAFT_3837 [Conidiobolus coronatus NRRL 28638]|uniref:Uncharacterized protein n=1 Tax=Conidiobolus coronatus (strain ATCC 28846 / CBS 209.66 / NRRL 28638) TaxID=796925 RepID=A0A137PDU0_CONC2|nr:hypothetical protein CONCODRAFT_3837 [Conidiobolus coronatus NRRL 28638]|eukprot:KXN73173.1 hypothetical protein CONCODRAFT_3837 [Conidiobolus coronatus NRRL 28638]